MVTVVSKLLLLVALLGSFGNAASNRAEGSRGLSFLHPYVESEDEVIGSYYDYKSGKGGKSGKVMKSEKNSKESGKSMKSEKNEKYLEVNEVEVNHEVDSEIEDEQDGSYHYESKSSKNRPVIPDFEYIEIGYKSWKSSKSGKTSEYENTGLINGKTFKDDKSSKEGKSGRSYKLPKAPTISPAPTTKPAPSSTPRPTEAGSFGVGVPLYSLAYKLMSKDKPKSEELNELEEATRAYLSDFFFDEFDEDDFTVFEQFLTDILGFSASKDMPVVVDYESVARFDQLSTIKPTPVQLGSAVEEAFTGLHMIKYEDWLKEMLPSNNIFVGSKIQYYQGGEGVPDTSRPGIGATGIAASAVAFTLLVAGVVLYKSKSDGRGSGSDKLNKSPGDMTVAGETFAGETYDGTASVSAASVDYVRRYNDEEEGMKTDNLGAILESHDADSVKPTWSDDGDENEDEGQVFGIGIAPNKALSAFRGRVMSAPRTTSFEDVALQAPAYGGRFEDNVMPDPSSSEDDASQMSESELSQFVASTRQVDNQTSSGHTLEIKSLLSLDSMDENSTSDLSVRDNSSRRLRTVAEIEALLSSELKDKNITPDSRTPKSNIQTQHQTNRPRTVEEIESLLTADDDDTYVELPFSDEEESLVE